MVAMPIPREEINLMEGNVIFLVRFKLRSGNMLCIKMAIRIPFLKMRMTRLQNWKLFWHHKIFLHVYMYNLCAYARDAESVITTNIKVYLDNQQNYRDTVE
jgi:hypothetical protein